MKLSDLETAPKNKVKPDKKKARQTAVNTITKSAKTLWNAHSRLKDEHAKKHVKRAAKKLDKIVSRLQKKLGTEDFVSTSGYVDLDLNH